MGKQEILGSSALHDQLCLSSCILAELLTHAPGAVGVEALVQAAGHPRDEVELMCRQLYRNGLLQPLGEQPEKWMLAGPPASISLADLFSALLAGPNRHDDA